MGLPRIASDFPRYLARLRRKRNDKIEFRIDKVVALPTGKTGRFVLHEQVRDIARHPLNEHLVRVDDIFVDPAAQSLLSHPAVKALGATVSVEISTRATMPNDPMSVADQNRYRRAFKVVSVGAATKQELAKRVGDADAPAAAYRRSFRRQRHGGAEGVPVGSARVVVRFVLRVPPGPPESSMDAAVAASGDAGPSSSQVRLKYTCAIHVVEKPPPYTEARAAALSTGQA